MKTLFAGLILLTSLLLCACGGEKDVVGDDNPENEKYKNELNR